MHRMSSGGQGSALTQASVQESHEVIAGPLASGVLILADHATNIIPAELEALGLHEEQLKRHIAYDIGIESLTRELAARLNAPAILTRFSRLVIDPNRGPDDPTLVMRIADGALIPRNARIDRDEIEQRKTRFYAPYHRAISATLDTMLQSGIVPAIVSLHSFTPVLRGVVRPWHAGILWDADPRLAVPLIHALEAEGDIIVGDNEPYDGALEGDTIDQHATARGLANALVEVRQDLIADAAGVAIWAEKLARLLKPLLAMPDMNAMIHHESRTRIRIRPR
jgi:predicted N-formylglutamate amidohydrolase